MIKVRFLSIHDYIQRPKKDHFAEYLQELVVELSNVQTLESLTGLTQRLFSRAFAIPSKDLQIYLRPRRIISVGEQEPVHCTHPVVEAFLTAPAHHNLMAPLHELHMLIRDELDFDSFYEKEPHRIQFLKLLQDTNADLFIPIYEEKYIIGYMLIARGARPHMLFSSTERAEIVSYANYLSPMLYMLQHRNLQELIIQEKEMHELLFAQEREIQHYRESIQTLLKTGVQCTIGAGDYHRRKLVWTNAVLRDMLELDDEYTTHLAAIKQLGNEVLEYGTERSILLKNKNSEVIRCIAIPHTDRTQVLILAHRAHPADTFMIPYQQLKNTSHWHYSLYLDTTQAGAFIKQVIPGTTATILNFKVELFKAALSKRPILIEAPEEDTSALINILHHISMRHETHTITLNQPEQGQETAISIFGISSFTHQEKGDGFLSSLHEMGTLSIRNVEYLSLDSQERLAQFLTTGMFKKLLSDRLFHSNVRILCTTSAQLSTLLEQQRLSPKLYTALQQAKVTMPSLMSMPRQELIELARTISEQSVQSIDLKHLMLLTPKELNSLVERQPLSLSELRETVIAMLNAKSQKKHIAPLVTINRSPADCPPAIMQAAKLGKRALQDKNTMLLLWNYFKSQAKIAEVLGVNRATVHRRLKQYGIGLSEGPESAAPVA